MICNKCKREIDSNLRFCKYCGINLKENKKGITNIFNELFKNKKLLIGVMSGIVLLTIVVVVLTLILTSTKGIYNAFDNMIKLKSYNVSTSYSRYDYLYEKYEEEKGIKKVSIDDKFEKIEDEQKIDYIYNDKKITSEIFDNETIYYYDSSYNSSVSEIEVDYYSETYKKIFEILKGYKYRKKGNDYELVAEEYLDKDGDERNTIWDVEEELKGYLKFINNFNISSSTCTYNGCYKQLSVISNININIKNNYINEIVITYGADCYDENEEWIDCTKVDIENKMYKLFIRFSKCDNVKLELPKEVSDNLEKTTAGNWVGTYKSNKICSDGNSYEETLKLTDIYKVYNDITGWNINMKGYNCDDNYYSYLEKIYKLSDNKLSVYDLFGELVVEFEYKDGKIIEYDENNKIIATFVK